MINEADTCRRYVLPKLYSAGWNDDQINEQKTFTDGRIVVTGDKYILNRIHWSSVKPTTSLNRYLLTCGSSAWLE